MMSSLFTGRIDFDDPSSADGLDEQLPQAVAVVCCISDAAVRTWPEFDDMVTRMESGEDRSR